MITFEYNGLDFSGDMRINEIKGRGLTPSDVSTIDIPGMTGVHVTSKKLQPRAIEISFTVVGTSLTNLRDKINLLSERLDLNETAPLIFSDEPDKTYYAIMVNAGSDEDLLSYGMGTFTFLCPDPYKYGPEQIANLNTETGSIVNVAGTAPTKPIIELTANSPSTYALVANDNDEYTMMGEIADVDTAEFERYEASYYHEMQNVTNWNTTNVGETDYPRTGTAAREFDNNDGENYFVATDYGTGTGWHGPALKKSLPEPLQDFRAEAHVQFMNGGDKTLMGNIEMYLLDVNGNIVARIGLRDGYTKSALTYGLAHLGGLGTANRRQIINEFGDKKGVWNNFDGVLRLEREGKRWTAYIAKVDEDGTHHTRRNLRVWDTYEHHQNAVTQVAFAFHQHGTKPTPKMRVGYVHVDKLNSDEEGVAYIVSENDTVTFDHNDKEDGYRLNGEPVPRLKNIGATQFELKPGSNTLVIEPGGSFTGTVRWRDAYK